MSTNPDLDKYVSEAKAGGMPDGAIRAELVKAGWNQTDIDSALGPTSPSPVPIEQAQPVMQSPFAETPNASQPVAVSTSAQIQPRKSHLSFIITVIILFLIGGAVYFFLPQIVVYVDKLTDKSVSVVADDKFKNPVGPSISIGGPTMVESIIAGDKYSISDLGLEFKLTESLEDLTYGVTRFNNDQAVNSVGFSNKRLDSIGCSWQDLKEAPLGYLRYGNDQGGIFVASARHSDLYYIKPSVVCEKNPSFQNWQDLEISLKTLVSDYKSSTSSTTTADWKIYRNEKYGFELKYPVEWQLSEDGLRNNVPFISITAHSAEPKFYQMDIFIEDNPNQLSAKSYAENYVKVRQAEIDKDEGVGIVRYDKEFVTQVGIYNAYELENYFNFDRGSERIYVTNGNNAYVLEFPVAEENENLSKPIENNAVAHKIISTFKFVSEATSTGP